MSRSAECVMETIRADIRAIPPAVDRTMQVVREMDCASGKQVEVELALREALENAVVQSGPEDNRRTVEFCVSCDNSQGIWILVRDPATGLEPVQHISDPVTGRRVLHFNHGRGIFLINPQGTGAAARASRRRVGPQSTQIQEDLVTQLKGKSAQGFEELVRRYRSRLHSVSLRILRNACDAEDAVQETFLRVLLSIDSFRETSSLYSWLFRIVTNISLMQLRRRRRSAWVPIEPHLPSFEQGEQAVGDITPLPEQALRVRELSDFLRECIEELPESQRTPYVLKELEELPECQVCRMLRLSKPAMRNRVHRARRVIRQRIDDRFFK